MKNYKDNSNDPSCVNFLSRVFYLELEIKGLDTCFVRYLNSSKSIQSGFSSLLIMICTLNLLENAMTVQNSDKYLGKCVWKVESLIITKRQPLFAKRAQTSNY